MVATTYRSVNSSTNHPPPDYQHLEFWSNMITLRSRKIIPRWAQFVCISVFSVTVVFGLVGNALSFVVMLRTSMRKHSYSIYLLFLAVSDTSALCGSIMITTNRIFFVIGASDFPTPVITFTSRFGCKFVEYILHSFLTLSASLIAVISVERTIIVVFPFFARTISKRGTTLIVASSSTIVIFASTFYVFLGVEYWAGGDECYLSTIIDIGYHYQVATVFSLYLPVATVIVCNVVIYVVLQTSKMSGDKGGNTRVTKMLFIVTSTFVLVNLPLSVITFWMGLSIGRVTPKMTLIHELALLTMNINFSINFYLYLIGAEFRKAVKELCRC
ncbi:uncharacterized protein LOC141911650 [Tubulanus polymorphus]|uniref:uncharacterized protein LOC141911650 n=1 Tax=Tubulanus polymorphus TaxID=672921 RepID=UPI003DA456B8